MTAVVAAWDFHRVFQFDVWAVLFWVNVLVLGVIVVAIVLSMNRDRVEREPANQVEFLADDELEGPRLERVLGWALVFVSVFAVTMAAYWLRETARQKASVSYFDENAVRRGKELFSNEAMAETFNPLKSLKCADCHGVAGAGGSGAPSVYTDPNTGKVYNVLWRAPALNTVLYRFSPQEVHDIVTYGRPGTPMQPWGLPGGGPKNDQSVEDLVAYIKSIQLPPGDANSAAEDLKHCDKPKTALGVSSCALAAARTQPEKQLEAAKQTLDDANKQLADHHKAFESDQDPTTDGVQTCADILASDEPSEARVTCRNLYQALNPYTNASGTNVEGDDIVAVARADAGYAWAKTWMARRAGVSDGQLLFETNCARCHTKNWSIFDPTRADLAPENMIGLPGGGGSLGFNLRDGQVARRFPNTRSATGEAQPYSGLLSQIAFVIDGTDPNKPYGFLGQGSGKMPGHCNTALKTDTKVTLPYYGCQLSFASNTRDLSGTPVTEDDTMTPIDDVMIEQIVLYERCGLDLTDASLAPPKSDYALGCS